MPLPALATLADLDARLPTELRGAVDETRAQAALDDASALVRQEAGVAWTNEAGTALEDVPDIVATVVLEVARRALNRSFTYGAENEDSRDAGLFLKASEKRIINTATQNSSSAGLWTLATTRSDETAEEVEDWQDVGFGSDSRFLGDVPWAPS